MIKFLTIKDFLDPVRPRYIPVSFLYSFLGFHDLFPDLVRKSQRDQELNVTSLLL